MTERSPEERFWAKVDKNGPVPDHRPELGPCWIWTGYRHWRGYGQFGRNIKAHRMAYELLVGPIPEGLEPDHLCRMTACVNPAHLEPVTHRENMRRGDTGRATGARQRAKTHCKYGHPYDEENTYWDPRGHRACRTCHRIWKQARQERLQEAKADRLP